MRRRTFSIYNVDRRVRSGRSASRCSATCSATTIGDNVDNYLLPLIALIIVVSLIPPFLEWRKAARSAPGSRSRTDAEAEAEAAELHADLDPD